MTFFIPFVLLLVVAFGTSAVWRHGRKVARKARKVLEAREAERSDYGTYSTERLSGYRTARLHGGAPAAAWAILLAFVVINSITVVDARAVGIQTGFGRYEKTLDNGFHVKAPWSKVEEFTTRLQTGDLDGKQGVNVAFKGGGSGTVNANFRWAIKDDTTDGGAKALWEKYRDFESVQKTLVLREGKDVILNVANDYTPNEARTKQDIISGRIKTEMITRLDRYGIEVDSVSVLSIPLDARSQAALDKTMAAENDVERAKADRERAKIDNETAQLREKSGALTGGALTRYCLDVVNNWDTAKNGKLPETLNCDYLTSSSDPAIIVGGTAKK